MKLRQQREVPSEPLGGGHLQFARDGMGERHADVEGVQRAAVVGVACELRACTVRYRRHQPAERLIEHDEARVVGRARAGDGVGEVYLRQLHQAEVDVRKVHPVVVGDHEGLLHVGIGHVLDAGEGHGHVGHKGHIAVHVPPFVLHYGWVAFEPHRAFRAVCPPEEDHEVLKGVAGAGTVDSDEVDFVGVEEAFCHLAQAAAHAFGAEAVVEGNNQAVEEAVIEVATVLQPVTVEMLEPLPREEQGMMIPFEDLRQHGHARHHRHSFGVTDIIPFGGEGVMLSGSPTTA
jgi:hypothetical protein